MWQQLFLLRLRLCVYVCVVYVCVCVCVCVCARVSIALRSVRVRHRDNAIPFGFCDMHAEIGFQDYVVYELPDDPRWFQVYDPIANVTYNLLLPSGALVSMTAHGNRTLFHAVPAGGRGKRISKVARCIITGQDMKSGKLYDASGTLLPKKLVKPADPLADFLVFLFVFPSPSSLPRALINLGARRKSK